MLVDIQWKDLWNRQQAHSETVARLWIESENDSQRYENPFDMNGIEKNWSAFLSM